MQKLFFKFFPVILTGSLMLLFQNCSGVNFNPVEESTSASSSDLNSTVSNPLPLEVLSQTVEVRSNNKLDLLFVIDNSGSMAQEQKNLSQKIHGFMNLIKDMDWQIAMTTTDSRAGLVVPGPDGVKRAWGNGEFRTLDGLDGSQFILKSDIETLSSAQSKLEQSIEVGVKGYGNERGIHAVSAALNKRVYSPTHAKFFRSDSAFVVVLISDEDECSNGSCVATDSSSQPESLVSQINNEFGAQKVFKFNSIIKSTQDVNCGGALVAKTYEKMSDLTGGLIGSICDEDYTQLLNTMGGRVLELIKSVNLQCEPVDQGEDGIPDVEITLQGGAPYDGGFKMQGSTITFDNNLPEGQYNISYACVKNPN